MPLSGRTMTLAICAFGLAIGSVEARDLRIVRRTISPAEAAPSEPVTVRDVTPEKLKSTLGEAEAALASNLACTRKVKVIYAGYGEADRANCPKAASLPAPEAMPAKSPAPGKSAAIGATTLR